MKNKFAIFVLSTALISNFSAFAQEEATNDNFNSHKTEVISQLNKEKAIIETAISCFTSATKKEDAKKCHEQKRSSMEALRQEREGMRQQKMTEKKQKLQNEISKIDQEMTEKSNKTKK